MQVHILFYKMPKVSKSKQVKAKAFVSEFAGEFKVNPNNDLFCCSCNEVVNCEKRQSKVCDMVNQQVVSRLIDHAIKSIACKRENFFLLLTSAARYMVATGKTLKELFPNLHHVTCIAHLFNNCAEKVRAHFPSVVSWISSVKAVTVKNASRHFAFHDIGVPPQPIVKRWTSWLQAADYYRKNLPAVKRIVNYFEGFWSKMQKMLLIIMDLLNSWL